MRLKTDSGKTVDLNDSHFKAKGGEGSVYIKGGVAYKICDNPTPAGKIRELQPLSKYSSICAPIECLYNKSNLVGFSMRAIKSKYVWGELFTNTFKNDVSPDLESLTIQLLDIVKCAHKHNCLIVDANELNFIVDNYDNVINIDVNSWQTPSYQPTAIMPSVKDWRSDTFSVSTDYYSAAVLIYQAWLNIHPYKGTYDKIKEKGINKIRARRMALISTMDNRVSCPGSALSVDSLPTGLKDWMWKIFQKGDYPEPPTKLDSAPKISTKIEFKKVKATPYNYSVNTEIFNPTTNYEIIIGDHAVLDGKVYSLQKFNNNVISKYIANIVNPKAKGNVIFGDVFGKYSFLINERMVPVPELTDRQIIAADFKKGLLVVSSYKDNEYRLSFFYKTELIYELSDISPIENNFCVLDKGVALFTLEGDLWLMVIATGAKKQVKNVGLPSGSSLYSDGDIALIKIDNRFFRIQL